MSLEKPSNKKTGEFKNMDVRVLQGADRPEGHRQELAMGEDHPFPGEGMHTWQGSDHHTAFLSSQLDD